MSGMYELAPDHTEYLRSIAGLRSFLGNTTGALDAWDTLFEAGSGTTEDMITAAHYSA